VFISTATRLAAARREQRFAAMRLAGATPRQVSVVATVEAATATVAGAVAGFGLFYAFRSELAKIPFTGQPFFASDMRLSLLTIVVVALGIPAAAAVVAHVALRRVRISPLGTARRVRARRPSAWRTLPLLAAIGELVYFTAVGHPATVNGQLWAYLGGGALAVAGLVIAGSWLTMAGAALLARRASRPAGLLAARRLADDPKGSFRAISGLILAVFTATVAVGIITSLTDNHALQTFGAAGRNILIAGCSLAVGVVAGLTDRKRPFSLLRLAGTPLGLLRRVIALESSVPLLAVAVVSAGLGLLVAELFLNSQLGLNLRPPGAAYYGFVAGGVLLSLGIIAATFPLLGRITGPEAARSE
jgi:hypothetical protein